MSNIILPKSNVNELFSLTRPDRQAKALFKQRVAVSKSWLGERWQGQTLESQFESFGERLYGSEFHGGAMIEEKRDVYILEISFWAVRGRA